ncbi:sporulation peptidase YabG [Alkalihalobacillus sp. LMS39]|uniref:sporulation peptidase YabG n=1 Tax=Alkalihalobacillus sp. LMS39 TaxID=2924032 RepID=UPI001FB49339|nr:sporulation peptidase YabG [Alkalihalobacillus sp. LMS39]UOE94182.1 sporulation peptidase YabG [Alkalihalobacillus sp. LMS39]
MKLNIGDIVGRKSYQCDLLFRVIAIHDDIVELSGEAVRLMADAPLDDIVLISENERKVRREKEKEREESCYHLFRQDYRLHKQRGEYETTSGYATDDAFFEMRGRVLHVDGDRSYLQKCTEVYNKLGIPVYGVHIKEKEMPEQMESLVKMVRPDILVITGHDAYIKSKGTRKDVKAYRHSKYYAEAVRSARKVVPHLDDLAIFAGACQSHFESIIKAGANFASSPERINIHALDPVYLVSKVSLTPFMDRVGIWEVLRNTITGERGIGGVETKGFLRRGMPLQDDEE